MRKKLEKLFGVKKTEAKKLIPDKDIKKTAPNPLQRKVQAIRSVPKPAPMPTVKRPSEITLGQKALQGKTQAIRTVPKPAPLPGIKRPSEITPVVRDNVSGPPIRRGSANPVVNIFNATGSKKKNK